MLARCACSGNLASCATHVGAYNARAPARVRAHVMHMAPPVAVPSCTGGCAPSAAAGWEWVGGRGMVVACAWQLLQDLSGGLACPYKRANDIMKEVRIHAMIIQPLYSRVHTGNTAMQHRWLPPHRFFETRVTC